MSREKIVLNGGMGWDYTVASETDDAADSFLGIAELPRAGPAGWKDQRWRPGAIFCVVKNKC